MTVWRSFLKGWGGALSLWPVVMLLYLVDTAFALILAVPAVGQLAGLFGHSTMAPDLLGPASLDWMVEVSGSEGRPPVTPHLYLLVSLQFLLVSTFLRGGTIGALAEKTRPFRWTDFFSHCARFFWRFLLLLLLLLPVAAVAAAVSASMGINLLLDALQDPSDLPGSILRGVALPVLLFLLLMAVDYARISLVLAPERSLWRHAGRGAWFLLRRFHRAVPLGVAYALAAALFAGLYPALLQLPVVAGSVYLAPLLQQATMLLLHWQRVALLGGEVALFREG